MRFRLLPHELCFGLFLVITWLRLVVVTSFGSASALLYLGLLALNAVAIWLTHLPELPSPHTPRTGLHALRSPRLGLLFYPVAMNIVFPQMKVAIPALESHRLDAVLRHADALLVGGNLSLRLQPLVHPLLTEFFSLCYLLFFPYLLFSLVYYFCGDFSLLKKFVIGLFTIYGLGFLGYSFVPATGPYVAMADQFAVPLTGFWLTKANAALVARGSNGVDVFPSLHCAVSSFFLFFDKQHRPWRFKLYLVPCVGLWLSTIYLRYHYFIDVVCGFTLAAFALWLANRFPSKPASQEPAAAPRVVTTPNSL